MQKRGVPRLFGPSFDAEALVRGRLDAFPQHPTYKHFTSDVALQFLL